MMQTIERYRVPTAAAVLLAVTCVCSAQATVNIDDAAAIDAWKGDARSQHVGYVADGDGGKAMVVTWEAGADRLMELNYRKPVALEAGEGAELVLWVKPEPKPIVNALALRVKDAKGETFQISRKLSKQTGDWQKLTYKLSADAAESIFGGNNDKKMDLPIALGGYATITEAKPEARQTLIIDNAASAKSSAKLAEAAAPVSAAPAEVAETPVLLVDMSDVKGLNLLSGRGGNPSHSAVEEEAGGKVYQITWRPGGKRLAEVLVNDRPALKAFDKGVVVNIPVNNTGYPGLTSVGLRVIDANGETWQWGTKVKAGGEGWQNARIALSKPTSTGHWGGEGAGKGEIDAPVRLLSVMAMAPDDPTEPRTLRMGPIQRNGFADGDVEQEFTLAKLKSKLALPDLPIKAVTPQTRDRFAIQILNAADRPIAFTVKATLTGAGGEDVRWQSGEALTLAPGETFSQPLGPMLTRFGRYHAKVTILSQDGKASIDGGSTALVYIQPTGPRAHPPSDGFWFGIDARIKDPVGDEWQAAACAMIGADYLRAGLTWPSIQPTGPEGGRWDRHVAVLDMLARHGLKASYGLSFSPKWAVAEGYKDSKKPGSSPPRIDAWRTFTAEVAKVNRERGVVSYEIWNEPDLEGFFHGTTDEYLELLRVAHEEIRKHHPEAAVISGGMATVLGHGGQSLNPDLIRRTIVDMQDHYEAIGHHEHGSFRRFVRALDGPLAAYRRQLRQPKPLWFTETGIPVGQTGGQMDQAAIMVKKHAYARAMNSMGFTWFVFMLGHEEGFGLVNNRREPLAAIAAYNAMTGLMRDKRFVQMHDIGRENWLIEFGGVDRHLFVFWDEDPATTGESVSVRLAEGARAEFVDLMGNGEPAEVADGILSVALEPRVRYLVVDSPQRPRVLDATARFTGEVVGQTGKPVTATVALRNPLPTAAPFQLAWRVTGQPPVTQEVLVPGDGSQTVTHTFTAPPGAAAGAERPVVGLEYRLRGTQQSGSITSPIAMAQVIPAGAFDGRPPDYTLATMDQVYNPNMNDPSRKQLAWSGEADLSAKVWLRLAGDALELRVDVKDDVHVKPPSAENMWQTDSVQFVLNDPERSGYWEIGLGFDGRPLVASWSAPTGVATTDDVATLSVQPMDGGLRYLARLPLDRLGYTAERLRARTVKFNLLVNDADTPKREGWIHIAPHLGMDKNPDTYPAIRFE